MGFDVEAQWKALKKRRGLRITLIGLGSALLFAVANKLADNALTNVVDDVSALVKPPTFLVVFSEVTDSKGLQLETDDGSVVARVKVVPLGDRAVEVSVAPGNYLLKLRRERGAQKQVLNVPVALRSTGASLSVDASLWAPEGAASHFEGTDPSAAANLIGTRWITTPADWDVSKSVSDNLLSRILKMALGQVGVSETGSDADKATILAYFRGTNITAPTLQIPWGGAFLDWVMGKSGAPVTGSAAFGSWQNWGTAVPSEQAQPGMIAVFDFPGLPQAPSRLLVGIVLRRTAECTEIIAGNIANRVVITCVTGKVKFVRRPSSASAAER